MAPCAPYPRAPVPLTPAPEVPLRGARVERPPYGRAASVRPIRASAEASLGQRTWLMSVHLARR